MSGGLVLAPGGNEFLLTPAQRKQALIERVQILEELARRREGNQLDRYGPYKPQLRFHQAGAQYRERLLMAGNQLGKTWSAAFETAMHLTGRYPPWWRGKRFANRVRAWGAGETAEVVRGSMQLLLCGPMDAIGTGAIPRDAIVDRSMKRGVVDAIDTIIVRWGGGGDVQARTSKLTFKSYDAGREKFQAATLDWVWLDEEPDLDIYLESLTRTNATKGCVALTFTPLKGMSETVKRFLIEKPPGTHVTTMTIYDALHYTPEEREAIILSYPAHIRKARAMGVPTLGSGLIYPIEEEAIKVAPFAIPDHWVRIAGIDFGWTHPTAASELAWDRDTDVIYVTKATRRKEVSPLIFANEVKHWGEWLPWAWPSDGLQKTSSNEGRPIRDQYAEHGLAMLDEVATHPEDDSSAENLAGKSRTSVDAGLLEILDRMQTGRFKVFSNLEDWWQEFRMYHREDGKIVKIDDDLLDSTRYAYMMRRHATAKPRAMKPWGYKHSMVT